MENDIRQASIANLSHTQNSNRSLLEKALKMRCEAYLAQAKTTLLTQTIFEVNRGRKQEHDINLGLQAEKTIIKQQQLKLEHVNHMLEEANADLEAYAYTVSHDLKNPIHVILGYCELLESESSGFNETLKEYINIIKTSTQSVSDQIDGLLKLSHYSRSNIQFEMVDLSAVANEVVKELKLASHDQQVEVIIQPGMNCYGDKYLLKSLLQNLFSNAWKYSRGIKDAQIIFSQYSTKAGENTYTIKDRGVGFNASLADKLFQPFQRLHNDEKFEGMGIGLATVKRIILRHHGKVWAESEINKGTTVYFSLPNKMVTENGDFYSRKLERDLSSY